MNFLNVVCLKNEKRQRNPLKEITEKNKREKRGLNRSGTFSQNQSCYVHFPAKKIPVMYTAIAEWVGSLWLASLACLCILPPNYLTIGTITVAHGERSISLKLSIKIKSTLCKGHFHLLRCHMQCAIYHNPRLFPFSYILFLMFNPLNLASKF